MRNISPLRYRWPFPAKFFFYLLTIATLLAPIPFVFFKPGVPDNVAGKLIEIKEVKTYPVNGKLYITSILVTNPDSPVFGAETIVNWATGPNVVLPREFDFPRLKNTWIPRRCGCSLPSSPSARRDCREREYQIGRAHV